MTPVSIVTIKNKIPLYKGEEQANSVELIEIEEAGFELVVGKDLYQIGDKAVYIQPDYNLSDIPLFDSFIRPNEDESRSMLGKVEGKPRRIRAKKFTLSKEPNGDPVYSNGILLPYSEIRNYFDVRDLHLKSKLHEIDLTKELGITKYEEPEPPLKHGIKTGVSSLFPEGVYKTDEDNILKIVNKIQFPIYLVGTEKIDGSSITIGITSEIPEGFICSRNLRKPLTYTKIVGRRSKKWYEYLMFWKQIDLNIYKEVPNDDDFVKYGLPYLKEMKRIGITNLVLRGELNGGSMKGSGNKNNPASKEPVNIKFFGIDIEDKGIIKRADYHQYNVQQLYLNAYPCYVPFNFVKEVFSKEFNSKEELLSECEEYFKNNMIEGIVVRDLNNTLSAKIMNLEYDSKK